MQPADLTAILATLQSRKDLSRQQMRQFVAWLLSGRAEQSTIAACLVALSDKGETVDELVGAAEALRDSMLPVRSQKRPLLDTCGTGGDGAKTFNISTAAAIAIAACGVAVAKHGNRKITSSTGSADVLAELGINLEASPAVIESCLNRLGICFCFAPHFHPAMRHVGPARREIATPTIFNRLGPLANPASAEHQVLGVGAENLQRPMAEALQRLGSLRSLVVRGEDGVDEISLTTATRVFEVTPQSIVEHRWSPEDFGLPRSGRDALFADDPTASAACIRDVLDGKLGACRDVVVLNAAAGLWVAGVHHDLRACARQVQQALDAGHAKRLLEELGQATQDQSAQPDAK